MILLFYVKKFIKYYFNDKKSKKTPSGDQTGCSKYFCWFDSPCPGDLRSFKIYFLEIYF